MSSQALARRGVFDRAKVDIGWWPGPPTVRPGCTVQVVSNRAVERGDRVLMSCCSRSLARKWLALAVTLQPSARRPDNSPSMPPLVAPRAAEYACVVVPGTLCAPSGWASGWATLSCLISKMPMEPLAWPSANSPFTPTSMLQVGAEIPCRRAYPHVNALAQLAWLSWSPLYWPPNIAATSRK